jgi:putative transposase
MPRPGRLALGGQAHHLIQRGVDRQAIFFEDRDRIVFLEHLATALKAEDCVLHAYVLMTNHVHLLVTPATNEGIGRLMQSLGRRYVGHFNRRYGRTGTLWEGRFKSTIVDAEDYVMACYRYIEANPLRAKMVASAGDYPWSSHGRNALGRPDGLVGDHLAYASLGATPQTREEIYRETFAAGLSDELLQALRDSVQRGWAAGGERFRRQIEGALGRKVDAPVRGRPRKTPGEQPADAQLQLL